MTCIFRITYWYIFQKRELKRFYQQQSIEKKVEMAVTKEKQITNVLNLHRDAVIIFHETSSSDLIPEVDVRFHNKKCQ